MGVACVQWPVPLDALDTRHVSKTGRDNASSGTGHWTEAVSSIYI